MSYNKLFEEQNRKVAYYKPKTVFYSVVGSALLSTLANSLSLETKRITRDSRVRSVESDVMLQYLTTLLEMRITRITGKSLNEHRAGHYNYVVPSIFNVALSQIGTANDVMKGINFIPVSGKIEYTLEQQTMIEVSNLLLALESDGFKLVVGSPKTTEGNVETLAIQEVDGELLSYRSDNFVNGFWAALLKIEWLYEEPNVSNYTSDLQDSYGEVIEFASYIPKLITVNG